MQSLCQSRLKGCARVWKTLLQAQYPGSRLDLATAGSSASIAPSIARMSVAANICREQAVATGRACSLRATSFCPAASRALATKFPSKRVSFRESSRGTFCQGAAPQLVLLGECESCRSALVDMHLGGALGVEHVLTGIFLARVGFSWRCVRSLPLPCSWYMHRTLQSQPT